MSLAIMSNYIEKRNGDYAKEITTRPKGAVRKKKTDKKRKIEKCNINVVDLLVITSELRRLDVSCTFGYILQKNDT